MKAALDINDLQLQLGGKSILHGLSLDLDAGQLVGICGLNGVGKSSLLRSIVGLEQNYSGEIRLMGKESKTLSVSERSYLAAYISTDRPRNRGLSVATVLELACHGRPLPRPIEEHKQDCLIKVGAQALAHRTLDGLSDGEMQKVMMARALAQNTPLIIADEPTAFLDYQAKREIMSLLRSISQDFQKLIILTSHDLELMHEFADLRFELANGKLKQVPVDRII
jgi:iron complex transport system ATP-binding protein